MPFLSEVVLASGNAHKYRELSALLAPIGASLVFGPEKLDLRVEEKGKTYAENALLKAAAWSKALGMPAVADDSGLEVRALDWEPGLFSARVASSDSGRIRWLFERLRGKDCRSARFVACIALVWPEKGRTRVLLAEGICWGRIAEEAAGSNGFGYDPVFIPDGYTRTFAELGDEVKSRISHRAIASRALRDMLEQPDMVKSLSVRSGETD
ncbi:MAG: RdgB/HAM1 family non-canonical purine NTP pyrophosphatase [Synergistaceae bacterium]|jgi:XTP/dITP diphosphohydrolase|nr:RdgB/HAM1 family non-canonical purine NTP pyrophosphatase [Synergistaceae bacterium]